ncbi:MAG: 4Fe-4S dicluster domain-containing protein [Proteobacteria bacterium]|nr:4Fe-4S dicluster domain-containing protein [Pseudomonadota bacterium]MBU1595837.1 4Fe-4S dicluster domain-containing protein [Pseudomonadota bacterium]
MSQYRITLNANRCIGCKSCLVHCTVKNQLPPGISLNRIKALGPFAGPGGQPRMEFTYQNCLHCDEPYCVKVCPSGSLTKRPEDGLIHLNMETCIACHRCEKACPWDVPVFVEAWGKTAKCDYCIDRLERGLEPACVTGCTAKALTFERLAK